jgi:uncharacterized protein (DUF1778 family)
MQCNTLLGREAMTKGAALNLRIEPELKTELEAAAKADGRTVSSLVQKLIRDHCEKARTLKQSQKDEPK